MRVKHTMSWRRCLFLAGRAYQRGEFDEAEQMYLTALKKAQAVGRPHWRLATNLGNLAEFYRLLGRYAEAEPLFRRAIEMDELCLNDKRSVNPPHDIGISYGNAKLDLSTDLNNLALLCTSLGRFVEAESLFRKSLALCREVTGPEHPEMAIRLDNLVALYRDQGRNAEAEAIEDRSAMIRAKLSH